MAFEVLKGLGDETLDTIQMFLREGRTAVDVALWIQEDRKLLTDMEPEALQRMLQRYNKELKKETAMVAAQSMVRDMDFAGRVDALRETTSMAAIQKARVLKIYEKEQEMPGGLLLKQVSEELELFRKILTTLGTLQLETGILPRAPKVQMGQVEQVSKITDDGRRVEQVIRFAVTDEHQGLMELIDAELAELQGPGV